MANEAVLVLKTEEPIDFIVLDDSRIEKGTIMKLSGSSTIGRTVLSGSGTNVQYGGIARREKIANDGRTRLSCFRGGVFRCLAAGAWRAGDPLMMSGSNTLTSIRHNVVSGSVIDLGYKCGTALEDATDGQTKEVWMGR